LATGDSMAMPISNRLRSSARFSRSRRRRVFTSVRIQGPRADTGPANLRAIEDNGSLIEQMMRACFGDLQGRNGLRSSPDSVEDHSPGASPAHEPNCRTWGFPVRDRCALLEIVLKGRVNLLLQGSNSAGRLPPSQRVDQPERLSRSRALGPIATQRGGTRPQHLI